MKIYSWNVNGIRAIMGKGFVEWVNSEKPDILCLQETKAAEDQIDLSAIRDEGYEIFWNAAEKKGYSGVATFSKMKSLSVKYGFETEKFNNEGRIIITEFEDFTLFNIYFPNGQMGEDRLNYKLEFYDEALKYFDSLRDAGKNVIICGDYNTAHREVDLKNPKSNENYSGFLPIERQWIDKLISHGYVDVYRTMYPDTVKYSWWSYRFSARARNIGWRIDYFFVNQDFYSRIKSCDMLNDIQGSDHCPIFIEI
ncbi:exodeoxyribonuclease [Oxobacter pfennigii]|uniref:Exodeoxyribonuclease n=1 Tax=Oxobacter pfennigii TaxID=36849 RepID=A0A0P8X591_9CLOT|nr:exodeoxyribonuclease III [Oxobacter pfennigii]KPU45965.1 exodeoxyribonuclease [Oxobacter pfennigii]